MKNIKDPQVGWLYFVGEDGADAFEEYVYTEAGKWEFIGFNSVNLSNYVQKTDYATSDIPGLVKAYQTYGLTIDSNGEMRIYSASANDVDNESLNRRPLTPSNISKMMSNYNITKSTIPELQAQETLSSLSIGLQRKNLLKNACANITRNGVEANINQDGGIVLKGFNNIGTAFVLYWNLQTGHNNGEDSQYIDNKKWLPTGEYILSGGGNGYTIQIRSSQDNKTDASLAATTLNSTEEIKFAITDNDKYIWCRIFISSSANFGDSGITIYPMIRPIGITDNVYEPYIPNLQEQIDDLKLRLAALEAPHTASNLIPENLLHVGDVQTREVE